MRRFLFIVFLFFSSSFFFHEKVDARAYRLSDFDARPPIHIRPHSLTQPLGMTPLQIKKAYNLPLSGGSGTIAIVDAYNDPTIENDLQIFDKQFHLPDCTIANGCFEKYKMTENVRNNSGWALETALDVEWAHAIAPHAKILLIAAKSSSGTDLSAAVSYAKTRDSVVSVSMSWGGQEFPTEMDNDSIFESSTNIKFFAAAGDSGNGVEWPAVSRNVIAVGGTKLTLGKKVSETAWIGSGGGISLYEKEPDYQIAYNVPKTNGKRAVPDVSYNADQNSGYAVYSGTEYQGQKGWFTVGGTSAGAPQWAAINTLNANISHTSLYKTAASSAYKTFFRDIVKGTNGFCIFFCTAAKGYDYVTGLGSPIKITFK